MYIMLGVTLFMAMGGWGRPGPLVTVESTYKIGRIFGVVWIVTWILTFAIFPFHLNWEFIIWNIVYLIFNIMVAIYLIREWFYKKNHDLIKIINDHTVGGILILFTSFAILSTSVSISM